MFRLSCTILLVLLCIPMIAHAGSDSKTTAIAEIKVAPTEVIAGSYQEMVFEFTAGDPGIVQGGGVRIELPVAYLETGPYYWDKPQTDVPGGRGYVSAASSGDAAIDMVLYGANGGVVECRVSKGRLGPGEKISLHYSGLVQSYIWDLKVRAQWRSSEADFWKDVSYRPHIKIIPHKATTMLAVAPAVVKVGSEFDLEVVLMDKFGNRATGYRGAIGLSSPDLKADIPDSHRFTAEDSGRHVFKGLKYNTTGFQCLIISDGEITCQSNYSDVSESEPAYKLYFGETHFHTGSGTDNLPFTESAAGGDHRGHFTSETGAYEYLRDVMCLDFGSAAEHDAPLLDEETWAHCQAISDDYNNPGEFTTFYAYEWTASPTDGHHVVVYKDPEGAVISRIDYPTKPELCRALEKQGTPAIFIPHPMWAQSDHGIWDDVDNKYRKLGEIYSLWTNRFLLQPGDEPQRFEQGINDRWSFQYAWHNGHKIGVIGSTDNHTGLPGANNYTVHNQHSGGLAAVLAKGNNREDLWDAFQSRRTYATTGTRTYIHFTADGHYMGDEYTASKPPEFMVRVAGTDTVEKVELVKYDGKGFKEIYTAEPGSDTCIFSYTDSDFKSNSLYYVRVTQVDAFKKGKWAKPLNEMAWSSPIWINHSK